MFLDDPPQFQPLRCGGWIYCLFGSHIQPPKYKPQIHRWKKGQKLQEQSAAQRIYNRLASTLTRKCCETSRFMAAARNYSLNYWHLRPASGHQETPETKGEGVGCALRAVKPERLNRLLRRPSAIQNSQQHKTIPFCTGAHLSCTLKFCTSSPLARTEAG